MKKILLAAMAAAWMPVTSVQAVRVAALYQAEVPVISQTGESREQAVRDGFLQVLIKVSGDPQIEKNPLIRASLKRAEYYVHDYSFSTETPESSQYLLQIQYEPRDINRLLKKARVAYWGENRPLILVWVAVAGQDQDAAIIGSESSGSVYQNIHQMGKKYGLPLIFPMMDVSDINLVSPEDVASLSLEPLKDASRRYSPDVLLIGDIRETETGVQSKWQMQMNTTQWNWKINGKSMEAVVTSIMNQVNQTLISQYDLRPAGERETSLHLEVTHILKPDDLSRLIRHIKNLAVVERVELSQVEDDKVDLTVRVRGPLEVFRQQSLTGNHLVLKSQNQGLSRLNYEWMR